MGPCWLGHSCCYCVSRLASGTVLELGDRHGSWRSASPRNSKHRPQGVGEEGGQDPARDGGEGRVSTGAAECSPSPRTRPRSRSVTRHVMNTQAGGRALG